MKINTAILLAGGKSRRMGFDKRFIEIQNKTMIDYQIEKLYKAFERILLVTDDTSLFSNYPCEVIKDEFEEVGVLGGIYTGLKNSQTMYNYVLACDMPSINYNYIQYMKDLLREAPKEYDGLITQYGEWIEPFNACYHKKLMGPLKYAIENGHRRLSQILQDADVLYVDEETARGFSPDWGMFTNLNSADDLSKYLKEEE